MSPRLRAYGLRLEGLMLPLGLGWLACAAIGQVAPDAPRSAYLIAFVVLGLFVRADAIDRGPVALRPVRARLRAVLQVALGGVLAHVCLAPTFPRTPTLCVVAALALIALTARGTAPRLWRLVVVEWSKLWRSRLLRVGLLAAALLTLLAAWAHEPLAAETGWALAARALGTGLWAAEVLVLVLGATTISGELAQGTLKMILPHAYRRSEWIAAKALALMLAAVLFAVVVGAVAWGHTAATTGFGDITKSIPAGFGMEQDSVELFRAADVMAGHLRAAWWSGLLSLMASALLGLLFSSVFSSVVPALSATFLLFLGIKSADVLLGVPRSVLQHVHATYPEQLREWLIKLGRGLNERWDVQTLPNGLWVAFLTGALAWVLSIILFERRDLHG